MTKHDRIWINANLLTMAENQTTSEVMRDAAIACTNGSISWIGRMSDLPTTPQKLAVEVIDVGNQWITPGLIDCHTHIIFGGQRAAEFQMRLQGKTYAEIAREGGGILGTVRATRQASTSELMETARLRLIQLLNDGVTTIEIKSGYGLDSATETRMLQVARQLGQCLPITVVTSFLGAHTLPEEYLQNRTGYLDLICQTVLPALAGAGLVDAVDAFCESIAFTPAEVERVFKTAQALNLPVKLHAEQLSNSGGAQLASRYRALSVDHLEFLDEAGVHAIAGSGGVAVLLPGAYFTLRETRSPPIKLLRACGVPMALATDCNPGSSPVLSLRLMMNMGCQQFGLTPHEALQAVTIHAARALGLNKQRGSLEIGKFADMVVWNISDPAELAYWLGGELATTVIKEGRPIQRHAATIVPRQPNAAKEKETDICTQNK